MPYVQRDANGRIISVLSDVDATTNQEWLEADAEELRQFLALGNDNVTLERLADSDQSLIRVLEDLIETLIRRNLIHFTDLPEAAQAKLLERRSLRRSVNALNLIQDDDQTLI